MTDTSRQVPPRPSPISGMPNGRAPASLSPTLLVKEKAGDMQESFQELADLHRHLGVSLGITPELYTAQAESGPDLAGGASAGASAKESALVQALGQSLAAIINAAWIKFFGYGMDPATALSFGILIQAAAAFAATFVNNRKRS